MPGIAASKRDTWLLGSPPNAVEAPENSFALEVTWACTSMPTTTSQSPVAPLMSFDGLLCTFITFKSRVPGGTSRARLSVRYDHAFGPQARAIALVHGGVGGFD